MARSFVLLEPLCFVLLCLPGLYYGATIRNAAVFTQLAHASLFAAVAFVCAYMLIPALGPRFLSRGLKGKDMGRRGTASEHVEIPSGLGLVCAVVFLICAILTQAWVDPPLVDGQPKMLVFYHSALLSICFMTLLGFADDVLDLPWRYKFILPVFASLPLLLTYNGGTAILLPPVVGRALLLADGSRTPLGWLLGALPHLSLQLTGQGAVLLEMGLWYFLYMGCLGVFATNAINIYAGINGLEAGQALVVTLAVITTNLMELAGEGQGPHMTAHLFSALLGLPSLAVTAALLCYNLFPASGFVGDTFCYFAGMTLAVQGIHGHFAKTLLVFFAPQAFNFFYSLPQIAKVYPCPRHRLPHFNPATGLLEPSRFEVPVRGAQAQAAAATGKAAAATSSSSSSSSKRKRGSSVAAAGGAEAAGAAGAAGAQAQQPPRMMDNFTLINLVLRLTGPMHERTTTNVLLGLQVLSCVVGLAMRVWHSNSVCEGRAWSLFSTYADCPA